MSVEYCDNCGHVDTDEDAEHFPCEEPTTFSGSLALWSLVAYILERDEPKREEPADE